MRTLSAGIVSCCAAPLDERMPCSAAVDMDTCGLTTICTSSAFGGTASENEINENNAATNAPERRMDGENNRFMEKKSGTDTTKPPSRKEYFYLRQNSVSCTQPAYMPAECICRISAFLRAKRRLGMCENELCPRTASRSPMEFA